MNKKFMVEITKQHELEQTMYQSVISRHDSSLVTLNSEDATAVDSTYGNGKFTCQLKNANRGGTHDIKVVPNLVMVPNVFNNVQLINDGDTTGNGYTMSDFQGGPGTSGGQTWVIPEGFYTRDEFISKFNATSTGQLKMAVTEDGYILLYTTSGSYTVQMQISMARMLGFHIFNSNVTKLTDTASVIRGWAVQVTVPAGGIVVANALPFMGTTPLVYIVTRQLAMNRMTASDSKEYNVIATVSMHDVPYGSYGVFRGGDIFMEDVEFRTPRALDQIDVELLDYKYRPLKVDARYPVSIQLKVFHTDTVK